MAISDSFNSASRPSRCRSTRNRRNPESRALRAKPALESTCSRWFRTACPLICPGPISPEYILIFQRRARRRTTIFQPLSTCVRDQSGSVFTHANHRPGDPGWRLVLGRWRVRHVEGEVFTVDRIEADGRATSTSTILYLDSRPRPFQDFGCSGTQSSRRVDSETVEILRVCANGEQSRLLWRVATHSKELILEITEQDSGGRRLKRRLVMEKQ